MKNVKCLDLTPYLPNYPLLRSIAVIKNKMTVICRYDSTYMQRVNSYDCRDSKKLTLDFLKRNHIIWQVHPVRSYVWLSNGVKMVWRETNSKQYEVGSK
jgi:hypothetical protein